MNFKKSLSVFAILFSAHAIFAQQDGYWDKDRATAKEIIVSARDRMLVKTEDFPAGTTEVVYRITLLDENQQMANSLVSVLKSIPDPSGIAQGSAGAVFLLSKISGDDKCKYALFSSAASASDYIETGKTEKACLTQNTPVSKDAKRISADKSGCIQLNSGNLWFGFESRNWIMNQKVVLEVVPWVDNKLSRGWTVDNRKAIIKLCKSSDLVKKMIHSDDFCVCVLEKFQKKYTFNEYDGLMAMEKSKAYRDFGNECLTEKPANIGILNNIRTDAAQYFKAKKYHEAIDLIQNGIFDYNNAKLLDYNAIGTYFLYSKQYGKAIKILKDGEKLDDSELLIKMNLAHAYLLNGDFKLARDIHKKYFSQNVSANLSWVDKTKSDFEDFKKAGIILEDFDRISKLFN